MIAGCDSGGPAGAGDDGDVAEACDSLCEALEDCPVFGGDGCFDACEDASDGCRECLADSDTCGDDCADACADDLGPVADDDQGGEPSEPATCDVGRCQAYCDAAVACDPYVDAVDCMSGCESRCGDGTFERADAALMECVIMSATCDAASVCCGSGDDKSASDFCI